MIRIGQDVHERCKGAVSWSAPSSCTQTRDPPELRGLMPERFMWAQWRMISARTETKEEGQGGVFLKWD